jgi:hypothetical protein
VLLEFLAIISWRYSRHLTSSKAPKSSVTPNQAEMWFPGLIYK